MDAKYSLTERTLTEWPIVSIEADHLILSDQRNDVVIDGCLIKDDLTVNFVDDTAGSVEIHLTLLAKDVKISEAALRKVRINARPT